jgi:hypothetical protein
MSSSSKMFAASFGDIPLARMLLAQYRYIKALLNKKKTLITKANFHLMYTKMLDQTDKYL